MKYGILGGGLCGVVLSAKLDGALVIEADDTVGGHCRTCIEDGYTYDIGGPHIIFSKNQEVLEEMKSRLGESLGYGVRDNRCYYRGSFVSYPFENGVSELPGDLRFPFVRDFIKADRASKPAKTLDKWLLQRFGHSLATEYLIPYNEKIWNIDCRQLSVDWVEGRIPMPTVEDMLEVACGLKTIGYAHQAKFVYPKSGGIEQLVSGFLRDCGPLKTNERVIKVFKNKNLWNVETSQNSYQFERLVSTIPILDLLSALENVPERVYTAAKRLKFNSLINIALGFDLTKQHTHTAVYIPQPEFLSHRISFPRNFSASNAPNGKELVNLEITTNFNDNIYNMKDDELLHEAKSLLQHLGYLDEQGIDYFKVHRSKFAYVVRDHDYKDNLKTVLEYVNGIGIFSLGRNAEFEYINMDEAIRRTNLMAERLNILSEVR